MYCRNCGKKLTDGAKFCFNCGTPVQRQKLEVDNTGADNQSQETENSMGIYDSYEVSSNVTEPTYSDNSGGNSLYGDNLMPPTNGDGPKRPKKKRRFWKVLLILVILAIVYFAMSQFFNVGIWLPKSTDNIGETEPVSNREIEEGYCYDLDEKNVKHDDKTGINYVNNVIIVFFEDGTSEKDIESVVSSVSGKIVGTIPAVNQYQVMISEHTYDELEEICREIEENDCVEDAYVDEAVRISMDYVPDDPWKKVLFLFGEKWDEDNPAGSNWWQEAINAPSAWEYNHFYNNINVGVVDNGCDLSHEDLSGRVYSFSDNNDSGEHGTHVSGIIGATPNNGLGISGIVWNGNVYTKDWELNENQEKKDDYQGWNTSTEIMQDIVDLISINEAKVINMSLGIAGNLEKDDQTDSIVDYQAEYTSKYLCKLLELGYDFVIVQSAGNGDVEGVSVDAKYNGWVCSINKNNCYTSESVSADDIMGRIIVVGAAKNDGKANFSQAAFSNAGDCVDICAPGQDIYSTVPGGYASFDGTSMAAPIVSGVASLVWSIDQDFTGADVKRIVCDRNNTKYTVSDNMSSNHPLTNTYQMVNAQLAVEAAIKEKEDKSRDIGDNPKASEKEINAAPIHFSGSVIKPEDVVAKFFDSLQSGDYETAAECLDPTTERQISFLGKLASSLYEWFTGEDISWGQLVLEAAGATDVELIECESFNMVYDENIDVFKGILSKIPGLDDLICIEADVYCKYRYQYNGEYYVEEEICHVERYGSSGWRVNVDPILY